MEVGRRKAREIIVQKVYSLILNNGQTSTLSFEIDDKPIDYKELSKEDANFVWAIFESIKTYYDTIIGDIKTTVDDFSFNQIKPVELAILLMAIAEIKHTETGKEIIINESLEIAKKYAGNKSAGFINGIIGDFIKSFETK
jgi:N utilization substance protein B